MEWFQLSYYSMGVFTCFIISFIMFIFLGTRRGVTTPTKWLFGLFVGFASMFFGYFLAYSVFAEWGAYHRLLTGMVVFGNASVVGFAYKFPRDDMAREGKFMMPIAFFIALVSYIHYAYEVLTFRIFYDFQAHHYNTTAGKALSAAILLMFIISLSVLIRKTIRYSDYQGKFKKRFMVGFMKFSNPIGKEAHGTKSYAKGFILFIVIGLTNVLSKAGVISYDQYATAYAIGSLLVSFYIVLTYLNNSPEPTTFMIKLVGISLVTLLLVIGFVGKVTLNVNESDYDNQRITEVKNAKEHILQKEFESLPKTVEYVLKRPLNGQRFQEEYELLYANPESNEPKAIEMEAIYLEEKLEKQALLVKMSKKIKASTQEEKEQKAIQIVNERYEAYLNGIQFNSLKRTYRHAGSLFTQFDFVEKGFIYQVGYSYTEYRHHTHKTASQIFYTILVATLGILVLFPKFFRASLVKPLDRLLSGVKKVNQGNLEVEVSQKTHDEIGFLATSFNSMVSSIKLARKELQDYAENLEDKVAERTQEVQEKMEEVQKLKVQQDGDYFLTSLLAKPLFYNANKSEEITTEFIIRQKKAFSFRNKNAELGGDICVTGNLRLGTPHNFKRYTVAMNGDAMGKSMQGAGGSLVMGVAMNSILARSASNDRVLDSTPRKWLASTYDEIHSIFKTFNGTMVISATIFVIENDTGKAWYINAEHPFTVLYRDGKASFIEEDLKLRKLGLDSEIEFDVYEFSLQKRDVVILGSDGRDDLDLTPDEPFRTINDDESLFLGYVEKSQGDLQKIIDEIQSVGGITDDLSLLRIGFKENAEDEAEVLEQIPGIQETSDLSNMVSEVTQDPSERVFQEAKGYYHNGDILEAITLMEERFTEDKSHSKLNRFLGLLCFKNRDYEKAVQVLSYHLQESPENPDLWYYLSVSQKKLGSYDLSIDSSTMLYSMDSKHVNNLVNLSDLYRLKGEQDSAKKYYLLANELDPQNNNVKKIGKLLELT
ncbi:MAG: SpoIIE family protein phosphatase [Spirochaetota bacterium]